jgi:hypothetical protein
VIVKVVALDVVWVVVADEKSDVIECWIEYLAIVCPAVYVGAVHDSATCSRPAVAVTFVGAPIASL